jgi:putative addiction module killer protein
MIVVRQHPDFERWFRRLRDGAARQRIAMRLVRIQSGLIGDVKYFDGIGEIRVDAGPGYRIYFVRLGDTVIVLLCAGDKDSQTRDIQRAMNLAKEV